MTQAHCVISDRGEGVTLEVNAEKKLSAFMVEAEREYLKLAIMKAGGNKRLAAEQSGVSYPTFMRRVARHGISVRPVAFEVVQNG